MKRTLWFVKLSLVASLVLAGAFLLNGCNEAKALNVNEVGADPAAYAGAITVVGVTKAFSQADATVFGIMDLKEMQCTTPNCNMPLLPVKYAGTLPAIGDEVQITGSFVQVQGGYLFAASDIKVVRRHQIGG
jgi:predicted small secreted protein